MSFISPVNHFIEQVNEVVQIASRNDDYIKNNSVVVFLEISPIKYTTT